MGSQIRCAYISYCTSRSKLVASNSLGDATASNSMDFGQDHCGFR